MTSGLIVLRTVDLHPQSASMPIQSESCHPPRLAAPIRSAGHVRGAPSANRRRRLMNQQTTQNVPTQAEPDAPLQDLQPQEDVKGGLLLPAVQKVREAAFTIGGG